MKPFQIILLVVFGFMAVGGIVFLATWRGTPTGVQVGTVTIWGTVPRSVVKIALDTAKKSSETFDSVQYQEIDPREFSETYIRALADGKGPDLILLSHEELYNHLSTLRLLSFETLSERVFRDTYIEGSEIYVTPNGIAGLPFTVDPMVLYWNRSLLQTAGIAKPPATWSEVYAMAPKLTEKDSALAISKSAIALGEFQNIDHAKEILIALFLQLGGTVIERGSDGKFTTTLLRKGANNIPLGHYVATLFTEFSNPQKDVYSWNRSLPDAKESFLAGELALYLGFASEIAEIQKLNPNLNFDVAQFPQIAETRAESNYAIFTAFAIPKASKNPNGAFTVAKALTDASVLKVLSSSIGLPPVRRDLLAVKEQDPYKVQFNKAALISRSWLDPNPEESDRILRNMIDSIKSGRMTVTESVSAADLQLKALLKSQ
jgi:multiple sugar transport system substrate-binding protein